MRVQSTLVLLAIGFALPSLASAQSIQINRDNKTIAISTSDEASATADIAAITIGFEIYGADARALYADGGRLSHGILEALHTAGVDDKAIESSGQGVQRNTDFGDKDTAEQRSKREFVFRQSWEVTATPQSAGAIIHAAVGAGANQSGAIDWRFSDRKALQAKAAGNALVKAREVAARMADGLHVKLGALIYASNETPNARLYFKNASQTVTVNAEAASVASVMVSPVLEIRPQTIREEATVYAVFAIE
jgi:uncharacterized protein YggE